MLRTALARLDLASRWLIIAAFAVMVVVVALQVLFRYFLNLSLDWADEVGRLSFVWTAFLGVPHGVKIGAHVGIDFVAKLMPPAPLAWVFRASCAACAALMGIVAWQSVVIAGETWDQLMPVLDFSTGWFYVAIAACGVHSLLHFVLLAWEHEPLLPAGTIDA
ncbi:MAG TPA: TRAP transporter small permease [Burkholderiales bacterium]|nr:TRAP transporter small permease [Burkholderiales bacterium]